MLAVEIMLVKLVLWVTFPILTSAHGRAGLPKVLGGDRILADLLTKTMGAAPDVYHEQSIDDGVASNLHVKRASCGQGVGSCAAGQCCSSSG